MLDGPHIYRLIIRDRRYSANFTPPATTDKLPKLYAICQASRLFYVGITTTRMSARLWVGLRASGEHGYHGYKLKNGEYRLDVWVGAPELTQDDLESIEAEVVYAWRRVSGQWPAAQNEIQFHRTNGKHRAMARQIGRVRK